MKINISNYFTRHLQVMLASLGQLWRQPLASLMTILVIGIALSLPAGLSVIFQNVETISSEWDDASQISVFLNPSVSDKRGQQITSQLAEWPDIADTKFQSAEQSLAEFRQQTGMSDLIETLPKNPLPAVIIIDPIAKDSGSTSIRSLIENLSRMQEVDEAKLDMDWLQRLQQIKRTGERGTLILAGLLSLSVLLIVGNTIRLAILNRQAEIRVIKLVGGTNAFVRRPFLYNGFWFGVLGGIVAWLILIIALWLLSGPVNALASLYGDSFRLQWMAAENLLMLPLSGLILGVLGAWLAVGRHLSAIEPT